MNRLSIILKLLPGFIPIIVYVLVEEIYGTIPGLVTAVAFGLAELVYFFVKDRKIDKFVLLDTLLIVLLGGVSIGLDNPIFFKIKPGLIQIIICAVLGLSAYSKADIIGAMTGRYMKRANIDTSNIQKDDMKGSLKILFWILILHTILIFYSSFYMSKEAWAFISSVLLYIIFGIFILFEFVKKRVIFRKYNDEEWLPIIDESGKVTGAKPRSLCHNAKDKPLHPVVHLHLLRNRKLYLQKRPITKEIQPGKWDTAVGGHVGVNEDIETALRRETKEEIGIDLESVRLLDKYIWESEAEREMVFTFMTVSSQHPQVNEQEVDDGRFWSQREIERELHSDVFTPNFVEEYNKYKKVFFG